MNGPTELTRGLTEIVTSCLYVNSDALCSGKGGQYGSKGLLTTTTTGNTDAQTGMKKPGMLATNAVLQCYLPPDR